jgi:hypothetical protein
MDSATVTWQGLTSPAAMAAAAAPLPAAAAAAAVILLLLCRCLTLWCVGCPASLLPLCWPCPSHRCCQPPPLLLLLLPAKVWMPKQSPHLQSRQQQQQQQPPPEGLLLLLLLAVLPGVLSTWQWRVMRDGWSCSAACTTYVIINSGSRSGSRTPGVFWSCWCRPTLQQNRLWKVRHPHVSLILHHIYHIAGSFTLTPRNPPMLSQYY